MQKKWPSYIEKAIEHNKQIVDNDIKFEKKDSSILLERKKRGRSVNPIIHDKNELINIKNMKTQFRKSVANYKLSEDRILL